MIQLRNLDETAHLLRVSKRTVHDYVQTGQLVAWQRGRGRPLLFEQDAIDTFIKRRRADGMRHSRRRIRIARIREADRRDTNPEHAA